MYTVSPTLNEQITQEEYNKEYKSYVGRERVVLRKRRVKLRVDQFRIIAQVRPAIFTDSSLQTVLKCGAVVWARELIATAWVGILGRSRWLWIRLSSQKGGYWSSLCLEKDEEDDFGQDG